ncbi:hypothetical protein EVJ58_g5448 [Rhodofomes roseus]|uniref:Uncharacterized protein n=1 Tax=Rhodofomes roseus TaxID=34475 RepID=A0A4Y9YGC5_9APHY|nr:hypothetical protein EVJ58_g5448 [Rhodofomes roseus]
MASHKRPDPASPPPPAAASSSKLHMFSQPSSSAVQQDAQPKTFKRLRSSLEQSIRTATKSKAKMSAPVDETGAIAPSEGVNGKGKGRASEEHLPEEKSKSRSRMLSKVSFRRPAARDMQPSAPPPPVPGVGQEASRAARDRDKDRTRVAGNTSFLTPSLRQASMSSPVLPTLSAYTQPFALPSGSTSNIAALVSPPREPRKPSLDLSRSSLDGRRPSLDRAGSPVTPTRPRALSPTQRNVTPNYYQNKLLNSSTTSLGGSSNPEYREQIRAASSYLSKEMLKPPSKLNDSSLQPREWEEVEVRMRGLARLERVWGRSGAGMGSSSQLSSAGGLSTSGLSASGEERERRLFTEALRDGYVLCQLMNKLFPGTISRVDPREDGVARSSNVTRFLAACTSVGISSEDRFGRDDLTIANAESLAQVARTVLALQRHAEFPAADKSRFMQGGVGQGPYSAGGGSRAAASTPNLTFAQMQRSTSPVVPHSPTGRKRWSPPQPLPTLRSASPAEDGAGSGGSSDGKTVGNGRAHHGGESDLEFDEVPPIMSPPPRSPLRPRPSVDRASVADSTRASVGDSVRASMADSIAASPIRQSQASTMTDTTAFSSLLEMQRSTSTGQNKFGTIRTVTTEATSIDTSETPSFTFAEGKAMAVSLSEELPRRRSGETTRPPRERRPSETVPIDLARVAEETEEGSSSSKSKSKSGASDSKPEQAREWPPQKASPIKLGKGKWPDDFIDAFQAPKSSILDGDEFSVYEPKTPISSSPPRKLAIVGASRPDASVESLPQFPRRPTHRARHSVDTPGLLPKDQVLLRDSSPDGGPSSPRIVLRRSSTRTGAHRNGVYVPRSDSRSQDSDTRVPFPRTVSAEHTSAPAHDRSGESSPPSSATTSKPGSPGPPDKPRQPRGRFQSEIDGSSSRRKPRPNSYDELGAKPRRSRYESMVNLGVVTSNASASDLLSRDPYEGSAVRQTLVVKEDGKPPTQFQLGNCIGRGQFGAVYRALNLNTGQMVAVKRIRLEGLKEDEIKQLMKEVDLVKSLSHPSIVKYEGMARDNDSLSIVLEYAENGSLGQTLKAFGKLNERLVAGYVVKILEGLHYLHQSDVVHCDLKAANILTTKNGNVKLSDFGVSLNLRAMEREMKDVAGTPNWMAPEVIELKGASTKSDIWSLACTVIELLTGHPPYAEIANSMSVMFRIVEDSMPPIPDGCSEPLQGFLRQCFNKDPTKRPSAEELCEHEWLKKNWVIHNKELRPQDSIPFLRRVSADYQAQKADVMRYLAGVEMPERPDSDRASPALSSSPDKRPRIDVSPPPRRLSNDPEHFSPREHSFVRTSFGKPVICRVCNQGVKKSAVLCEQCSLICHAKCAPNAPPTCDLRAQLLLYAQYAETGSQTGQYSNPMELLEALQANGPLSPTSDASDVTPRTSFDVPSSPSPTSVGGAVHPPSAYKVLAAFKRSKSFLTEHSDRSSPAPSSSPSSPPLPPTPSDRRQVTRKRSVLTKRKSDGKDRPLSISSSSTGPNTSSMRSAVTAAESLASTQRDDRLFHPLSGRPGGQPEQSTA